MTLINCLNVFSRCFFQSYATHRFSPLMIVINYRQIWGQQVIAIDRLCRTFLYQAIKCLRTTYRRVSFVIREANQITEPAGPYDTIRKCWGGFYLQAFRRNAKGQMRTNKKTGSLVKRNCPLGFRPENLMQQFIF